MNIDITKIGYRWKGNYNAAATYVAGDVVHKDGGAQVFQNGVFTAFALGQQDLTTAGHVLTGGASVGGQDGMVLHANMDGTVEFRRMAEPNGKVVVSLSNQDDLIGRYKGGAFVSVITNDGLAKGWGINASNQLGYLTGGNSCRPRAAAFPRGIQIAKVYSNMDATFYIDTAGKLYHAGLNTSNISGCSAATTSAPQMINGKGELPLNAVVTKFFQTVDYHGYYRVGCLTSDGVVYIWGDGNHYGCFGLGDTAARTSPVAIPISKTVPMKYMHMSGGSLGATFLISTTGKLYVAGNGDITGFVTTQYVHQLYMPWGMDKSVKLVRQVESDDHAVAGAQYYNKTAVLLESGELYMWGNDAAVQVAGGWGTGVTSDVGAAHALHPYKVATNVDDVYPHTSYNNTVILKKDGTVWYTGYSVGGGASAFNVNVWTQVNPAVVNNIVKLRAFGSTHAFNFFVLKSDGTLLSWGISTSGALGHGAVAADVILGPAQVKIEHKIVDFTNWGNLHTTINDSGLVLLTDKGDVYVCGAANGYVTGSPHNAAINAPQRIIF